MHIDHEQGGGRFSRDALDARTRDMVRSEVRVMSFVAAGACLLMVAVEAVIMLLTWA